MDPRPPLIRLAVFGKPVTHSLSPRIHTRFAEQLGLRVEYRALEATADTFPRQVRELFEGGGRGCNITVPLKREAWQLAANCSDRAERAQAANTLVFDGEIFADNTDGLGLVDDLRHLPGSGLAGTRVCILGAGGAAAGIVAALLQTQPDCLVIANRTVARARRLAERHADLGRVEACSPGDLDRRAPFDLIINATSLGHGGKTPALEAAWLSSRGLCYDLNYGSAATPLRRRCEAAGIPYVDGLGMLVRQAARSFYLWTGERPETARVLEELRSETPSIAPG